MIVQAGQNETWQDHDKTNYFCFTALSNIMSEAEAEPLVCSNAHQGRSLTKYQQILKFSETNV